MKKRSTIIILLFITISLAFSEEIVLTIDDAVSLSLKNNLDIKSERFSLNEKKWALYTSWNCIIPDTTLNLNLSKSNEKNDTIPQWSAGVTFKSSLTVNAAIVLNIQNTIINYKSGKLSLETARKELTKNIKKNFYNLILLEENIKLTEENLNLALKRYLQSQKNYKNGLISEYTMLSSQVTYENMKPDFSDIQNEYNKALVSFKQSLGIKNEIDIKLDGTITPELNTYNADTLISNFMNNRLDIKALQLSIESTNNSRNTAIAALTPSFSLNYTNDPTFQNDPIKDNWFGNADYMKENWKQQAGAFTFSVSIPISNLIPFSSQQVNILNKEYQLKQNSISLEKAKNTAEYEIKSLCMDIEKSAKSISSLKFNLDIAQKAYNLAEKAYNEGSKELLEIEDSATELEKAKLNLKNEQYKYIASKLDLEYAINSELK